MRVHKFVETSFERAPLANWINENYKKFKRRWRIIK